MGSINEALCFCLFCSSVSTDFTKFPRQFAAAFGQIFKRSRCSVFLPECVPYSLFPIILCLPADCGGPGGQGPSADYHEAADWIVFLIPGGRPLQEHPNTGVRLSSTGQTSVTHGSNYRNDLHSHGQREREHGDRLCAIAALNGLHRHFPPPRRFLTWRRVNREHRCDFLLTDNEVLRAEDPDTERVLRGLWRAARLSKRIHVEGNEGDEELKILYWSCSTF